MIWVKPFGNKYQMIGSYKGMITVRHGFAPVKQVARIGEYGDYLDTRLMTGEQKKKLFARMKASRPTLFNTIKTDTFIQSLRENFNASLLIEKRKR